MPIFFDASAWHALQLVIAAHHSWIISSTTALDSTCRRTVEFSMIACVSQLTSAAVMCEPPMSTPTTMF